MNQKGFVTIFGLCLILAFTLCTKGIQEAEMNHALSTTDFQTEFELQNAADSGIYAAAEIIKEKIGEGKLGDLLPPISYTGFREKQTEIQTEFSSPINIKSKYHGDIKVTVWAERIMLWHCYRDYSSYKKKEIKAENDDREVCIIISRAEVDNKQTGGKMYRRSFAYISEDINDWKIRFMELPSASD